MSLHIIVIWKREQVIGIGIRSILDGRSSTNGTCIDLNQPIDSTLVMKDVCTR